MEDYKEIFVSEDGKVLSRIFVAQGLDGVASLLSGSGAQSGAPASLLTCGAKVFLVYDKNVAGHAERLVNSLKDNGINIISEYALTATEEEKVLGTVVGICRSLMEAGADRNALLLALGGGITTDMAGFAASVYKRGIRFAYIPTTLLSQVDAAIGGKTGVNLDSYKNMVGVIRQPEFTWLCPDVLGSLDPRTFLSGAAEMLKTFIISDNGWYARAVGFLTRLNRALGPKDLPTEQPAGNVGTDLESDDRFGLEENFGQGGRNKSYEDFIKENKSELAELIAAAAAVKAKVVSEDQFEHGPRRKLNLGHTFAHAIEWRERGAHSFSHGEAVAVGTILAARLSEACGVAEKGLEARLRADFEACGLPVDCPFRMEELAEAMEKDKKSESGGVRFILIRSIGDVTEKLINIDNQLFEKF